MINAERVKQMVKLESFDEKQKDKLAPAIKYYRVDYIGMHILRGLFSVTIAFAIIMVLVGLANMEELMESIHTLDLKEFVRSIIIKYVIVTSVYTVGVVIYAESMYRKAKAGLKGQRFRLKRLFQSYNSNGGDK